jgi:hypothetical protein
MFEKWNKYQASEVRTGMDSNGNRLVSSFAKDYNSIFNFELCPNCKGFEEKFKKFLKKTKIMAEKKASQYVLKKMYSNIPLEFGSSVFVNNENMTDAYGLKLLKNHPRGLDLFDSVPNTQKETIASQGQNKEVQTASQLMKDNSKDELIKIAADLGVLDLDGNKRKLATYILEA